VAVTRGVLRLSFALVGALALLRPARAEAKGCHEESASLAVGRTTCSGFGVHWESRDGAYIALDGSVDLSVRSVALAGTQLAVCMRADGRACGPGAGSGSGTGAGTVTAASDVVAGPARIYAVRAALPFALAWGAFRWRPLFVEVGFGSIASRSPGEGPYAAAYAAGGTSLGATFAAGPFVLRGDVLLGVAGTNIDIPALGARKDQVASYGAALVEPRVGVDFYLTPIVAVGAFVAGDVLARRDLSAGVALRFSWIPFDGTR
jgi:hypothetical protein